MRILSTKPCSIYYYKMRWVVMTDQFNSPASLLLVDSFRPRFFPLCNRNYYTFRRFKNHKVKALSTNRRSARIPMDVSGSSFLEEYPSGVDESTEEEYVSQSKLLQDFVNISAIDKAWVFKSNNGKGSHAIFSVSQPNLLANKKRKYILSSHILKGSSGSVNFEWAPFPVETNSPSIMVPSPSGSKLLVIRNSESDSPTQFEIWGASQVEKEFHIPNSVHGAVYTDGWFEGISWNKDETQIAYIAEEPVPPKPTFSSLGYKRGGSKEKECGNWKGYGDWVEDWGETYSGKMQPAVFVINLTSGDVRGVQGIGKSLSAGQVIWAPSTSGSHQYLVFVGWPSNRKLGIKYCYNRSCALYAVRAPFHESETSELLSKREPGDEGVINLTGSISSAFSPCFSPDEKYLVFLSAKSSVDSGAHSSTNSLHRIDWPANMKPESSIKITDMVPVVMCAEDGCFPGLYCTSFLSKPWLSDGYTMILSSIWGSTSVILSVNILSGNVTRISPADSSFSWNVLSLDGDNIIAVCSSLINVPQIKYGYPDEKTWRWSDISSPISKASEKVNSLLSSLQFIVMKIPVKGVTDNLTGGAKQPFEAVLVNSKVKKSCGCDPLITVIHGGPHSVSTTSFSKSLAFLSSIGYSLLIVNYRGSLGFGEEALQSLPGKIGSQDVSDVLTAIDHIIDLGLADSSKINVLGGSHGGFLTTHLIGQAPDKFAAAVARNPVCNLALMVGTSDIPDWCFVEAYGIDGKSLYSESPTAEQLDLLLSKSPISHLPKVKTPILFLLGAKDLRVPFSNGLQYARALKEKGNEVKVIMFPNDIHPIDKPQSDFESFLNIGVWFKKHCK